MEGGKKTMIAKLEMAVESNLAGKSINKTAKYSSTKAKVKGRNPAIKRTETVSNKETTVTRVKPQKSEHVNAISKASYAQLIEKAIKHENSHMRSRQQNSSNLLQAKTVTLNSFHERMERYVCHAEQKREGRLVEDEYNKYKECTFVPATNVRDRSGNRTIDDFYTDQLSYLGNTQSRIKEVRNTLKLQETQEVAPAPKICDASRKMFDKMAASHDALNVYQRLNSHSKEKQKRELGDSLEENPEAFPYRAKTPRARIEFKFQPAILDKSKNLKRDRSVGELLHGKAFEQFKTTLDERQRISNLIDKSARSNHTLGKSDKYLSEKFTICFSECWDKVSPHSESLSDFHLFTILLEDLKFVENQSKEKSYIDNAWKMLTNTSSTSSLSKTKVYEFLRMVLGISTDEACKSVHIRFHQLYYNYTRAHVIHASIEGGIESTFTPSINNLSRQILFRSRSQLSLNGVSTISHHFDSLLSKGEEYEDNRRAKALELSYSKTENCTFHPNIEPSQRSRCGSHQSLHPSATIGAILSTRSRNATEKYSLTTQRSAS